MQRWGPRLAPRLAQDDEECDEGPENDYAAACFSSCMRNVCGDGLVHDGIEECDDGEAVSVAGDIDPRAGRRTRDRADRDQLGVRPA